MLSCSTSTTARSLTSLRPIAALVVPPLYADWVKYSLLIASNFQGLGVPPQYLNNTVGIVKAYTTRGARIYLFIYFRNCSNLVGEGPFLSEDFGEDGKKLQKFGMRANATLFSAHVRFWSWDYHWPREAVWMDWHSSIALQLHGINLLLWLGSIDSLFRLTAIVSSICRNWMFLTLLMKLKLSLNMPWMESHFQPILGLWTN